MVLQTAQHSTLSSPHWPSSVCIPSGLIATGLSFACISFCSYYCRLWCSFSCIWDCEDILIVSVVYIDLRSDGSGKYECAILCNYFRNVSFSHPVYSLHWHRKRAEEHTHFFCVFVAGTTVWMSPQEHLCTISRK